MATKNVSQPSASTYYQQNQTDTPPLGPRKTIFVLATVIGCIAILWPKIFYPMMFGATEVPIKNNYINKDVKPGGLRQERPPHLRGDHIHPAMIERGRAIPNTQSVPIINDKPQRASDHVQIIDGRPGPIPGMRPPMGAGSVHQANQKGSSMGLLMPMYTFGIVAFFVYTIMKLVMRKPENMSPYPTPQNKDDNFKQEVFRRDNKIPNLEWKQHDTIVTAIQGLIDAADEQLNKREISEDLSKDATEKTKDKKMESDKSNGHVKMADSENKSNGNEFVKIENAAPRCRDSSAERKLQSSNESEPEPEPQSIFLEGALPHESQILVSDSQTTPEGVYDEDVNGNSDEPAVILSSKMTLSLINLDPVNNESGGNASNGASDHESEEIEYEEEEEVEYYEEEEEVEEEEVEVEVEMDDESDIENVHDTPE